MNVLISPNAFKGTMSAREAGEIIKDFIDREFPSAKAVLLPIADGGDGTCELLTEILGLEKKPVWSLDSIGRPIHCSFGWDKDLKKAYIDVSTASGIATISKYELDPFVASSFGTGLLIKKAIDLGAGEIILGLGGSATVDVGVGILCALGVLFLDENGRELTQYIPDFLSKICHIQKSPSIPKIKITCLCDVKNTFFGDRGAIPVFGPQKGIHSNQIKTYEIICQKVVHQLYQKQKQTFIDRQGYGAAGGIALGLSAFFETDINFGSNYFFKKVHMEAKVNWADLIITGEGKYDLQSTEGKACYELMQLAHRNSKKIALITSGDESGTQQFDQVLTLPNLDFSGTDVKMKAQENLRKLLAKDLYLDF